jgi:septal ring factor EnvC (AmiA/AmiB activator)
VRWSWPADGEVIRRFGLVGQQQNDGIEIRTRAGAPVVAAADGVVVYEGDLASGLGKVVMVRHGGGYATTYANNSEVVATHGQSVRAGDKLALSSGTLAFEIRRGTVPEDPLKYLMAAGRRTR